MFKNIRVAILLGILLIVAVNSFNDKHQNWQKPVYVALYPINVDQSPKVSAYLKTLSNNDFKEIETFLRAQGEHYGKQVNFYYRLGQEVMVAPPAVPRNGGVWDAMIWSLKFRYYHLRHKPNTDFAPSLSLYLQYHDDGKRILMDTSTALQNGRIGVVNLFGSAKNAPTNNVVLTHESLHGFGATDKYDLSNGIPIYPYGYANPNQNPVYPQTQAELMAMHIAKTPTKFEMPKNLVQVVVGELTAKEIGWLNK